MAKFQLLVRAPSFFLTLTDFQFLFANASNNYSSTDDERMTTNRRRFAKIVERFRFNACSTDLYIMQSIKGVITTRICYIKRGHETKTQFY